MTASTTNIFGEALAPTPDAIDFANGVDNALATEAARRYHAHDEQVAALRAAHLALTFCGKATQARALAGSARRQIEAALAKGAA